MRSAFSASVSRSAAPLHDDEGLLTAAGAALTAPGADCTLSFPLHVQRVLTPGGTGTLPPVSVGRSGVGPYRRGGVGRPGECQPEGQVWIQSQF
jgi:hypothetical protein